MRGVLSVLFLLALLCAPALVRAEGAPLVAFLSPRASHNILRAPAPDALERRAPEMPSQDAVRRLLHQRSPSGVPRICELDAVLHVDADMLDKTSFGGLGGHGLKKRVLTAPFQMVLPALDQSASTFADELASAMESLCGRSAREGLRDGAEPVSQHCALRTLSVPDLRTHETLLMSALADLDTTSPEHLVLITESAHARRLGKRRNVREREASPFAPFLTRFQIFTTGTLLALGVGAFLVFFTAFAIAMISSVQIPDKLGQEGKLVSQDKKMQ
ncbi:hypothetical protein MSPP1_000191 [Malassezia sp. CBS 17886]|nr:hypothetical protein MSPP1_000191 [Malassezia sp. CBS 17886]